MIESAASATSSTLSARVLGLGQRNAEAVAAATLVAAGTAIAAVLAVRRPLSVDEAGIAASLGDGFRASLEATLEQEPGQTLYRALLHPLVGADGAEWALRAPSLAAVLIAAALATRIAARLAGRLAGLVAGTLLALGGIAAGVGFEVGSHALALLGVTLSTSLFVAAVSRGTVTWWVVWGLVTAPLPLVHPACATVVVAQVGALVVGRHVLSRAAVAVAGTVCALTGLLVAAAAVERAAAQGPGDESGRAFATAAGNALAWSPVALAAAVLGVVVLVRRGERLEGALLAGLAAGPALALTVAALAFPVRVSTAAVVALPGVALAAGVGVASLGDRVWLRRAVAATAVVAPVAALVVAAVEGPPADWRAAARFVESRRDVRETIVVLPSRARDAYVRYAPDARVSLLGRGEGVWVVLRTPWADAVDVARGVVRTPRYALLDERPFGRDLVVQHWVRP